MKGNDSYNNLKAIASDPSFIYYCPIKEYNLKKLNDEQLIEIEDYLGAVNHIADGFRVERLRQFALRHFDELRKSIAKLEKVTKGIDNVLLTFARYFAYGGYFESISDQKQGTYSYHDYNDWSKDEKIELKNIPVSKREEEWVNHKDEYQFYRYKVLSSNSNIILIYRFDFSGMSGYFNNINIDNPEWDKTFFNNLTDTVNVNNLVNAYLKGDDKDLEKKIASLRLLSYERRYREELKPDKLLRYEYYAKKI